MADNETKKMKQYNLDESEEVGTAPTTPGEAEGSLATVEADLREKEGLSLQDELKIDSEEGKRDHSKEYKNRPTAPTTPPLYQPGDVEEGSGGKGSKKNS